jgi:hypothetical protein
MKETGNINIFLKNLKIDFSKCPLPMQTLVKVGNDVKKNNFTHPRRIGLISFKSRPGKLLGDK